MSGSRQASHAGSWYSSSGKFCQIFIWIEHHIGDDFNLMTCMVLLFWSCASTVHIVVHLE